MLQADKIQTNVISRFRILCLPILCKNVNTKYAVWSYNYGCYLFGCQAWLSHESKKVDRGCSRTRCRGKYVDQPGECNQKLGKIARWEASKLVLRWPYQRGWNWRGMWHAWARREGSAYGALVGKRGGTSLESWNTCSYLGEFLNRLGELGLVSSWSGWEQMAGCCESPYVPVS
jgi:hypothetical protein